MKGELSFVGLPILEAHKACPHIKGYTAAAASLGDVPGSVEFLKRSALPTLSR